MIKTHIWTAKSKEEFARPGEYIILALIIGPDRDDPTARTLHIRANQEVIDVVKNNPFETRLQIVQGATQLLDELISRVLA